MGRWAYRGALMAAMLIAAAPAVMAEDEDGTDYENIVSKPATPARPRPKPKPRPAVVKKPAPEAKLPDAPIPYESLKGAVSAPTGVTGHMEQRVVTTLPTPAKVQNLPEAITDPIRVAAPPPPMPVRVPEPPPPPPEPEAIRADVLNLKCDTQVIARGRLVSQGAFNVEITPSGVFADSARFKVMFADPRHESLIKGSLCETVSCPVRISANFYELVNQRRKKGESLKVTLDRRTGAYLAQNRDGETDTGDYEQGYCLPQSEGRKLF